MCVFVFDPHNSQGPRPSEKPDGWPWTVGRAASRLNTGPESHVIAGTPAPPPSCATGQVTQPLRASLRPRPDWLTGSLGRDPRTQSPHLVSVEQTLGPKQECVRAHWAASVSGAMAGMLRARTPLMLASLSSGRLRRGLQRGVSTPHPTLSVLGSHFPRHAGPLVRWSVGRGPPQWADRAALDMQGVGKQAADTQRGLHSTP